MSDLGRFDEAMRSFEKAVECDPGYASAYENRGNTYVRQGQAERALPEFDRAMKLKPGAMTVYNNRAAAYFQLRRFPEAAADLETCRQLGGQPHPGLVKALAEAMKTKP
jgi:tetratricopeptide (TPR) repeat protein